MRIVGGMHILLHYTFIFIISVQAFVGGDPYFILFGYEVCKI